MCFQAQRKDNHLNIFHVHCHRGQVSVPGQDAYRHGLLSGLHDLHVLILHFQKWRKELIGEDRVMQL